MSNIFPTDTSAYTSTEFHGVEQADLGRFFLPDIEPEAIDWRLATDGDEHLADVIDWDDEDEVGFYERQVEETLEQRDEFFDMTSMLDAIDVDYGYDFD